MKDVLPSVREVAVLQEATEMILSSADLDTVLHQILLIVRNHFGVSNCVVWLLDASRQELYCQAHMGYDDARIRSRRIRVAGEGVTGLAVQRRAPVSVPDVDQEPRYIRVHDRVRSELALPLLARDEVIGVLDIESEQPAFFDPAALSLLALFAGQAAIAVENARLRTSEHRRMRQIELINLIARSSASAAALEPFATNLAELLLDTFEGSDVSLLLRQIDGQLALRAHAGVRGAVPHALAASEHGGIIARVLAARTLALENHLPSQPDWPACLPGSGAELAAPLLSLGELLGLIVVSHPQPGFFSADDRAIAQAAADVCATAIRNVQLAEELRRVASTDSLTGLYNQRYFHAALAQEVSRSRRYHKSLAAVMFDLRDFRRVNAALGFDGGDEVLRRVAHSLRSHSRSMDVVCRYAGDRFALVLPETDRQRVPAVLDKVRHSLEQVTLTLEGAAFTLCAAFASVNYPDDATAELELARLLLSRLDAAKKLK